MIIMKDLLLIFLIPIVLLNVTSFNAEDDSFGSCPTGKDSCSECYLALKKSLLGRDDNIYSLSRTFFPTQDQPPEFVTVTYRFGDVSNQTWFWSEKSSYLLFPIKTFQYLSLGFGKLERYVTQEVTLILDAECNSTDLRTLELLTQRVR